MAGPHLRKRGKSGRSSPANRVQNVLYQIYLEIGSLDFLVSGLKLVVISGGIMSPAPGGWGGGI